ncbi:MAG: hypothetical protein IKT98_08580 [Selenomonadaceae bacterium]|nr:hypothetical protein [Selenomonadaceae bacterium]
MAKAPINGRNNVHRRTIRGEVTQFQFQNLQSRMDSMEQELYRMEKKIERLKEKIERLNDKIDEPHDKKTKFTIQDKINMIVITVIVFAIFYSAFFK